MVISYLLSWKTHLNGKHTHCRPFCLLVGLDSITVSVFADIFIELTNIRRQDPNNYSDTETRCLVYVGLVASNGNGRLFHCCCEANNSLISAPHIFTHPTHTPETSGHVVNSALTITHRTIGGVCQPDFAIVWQSGRGACWGTYMGGCQWPSTCCPLTKLTDTQPQQLVVKP